MISRLERLENEIRGAAASRRYRDVARLVPEFGEGVRAYVRSLPESDPRGAEAASKLQELLSWSLAMLQAARFACATELRRAATATRYARPCGGRERPVSVHLDA